MSQAAVLAREAARQGFSLMLTQDNASFVARPTRPGAVLAEELKARLRESKAEIVAWFTETTGQGTWPKQCSRCGHTAYEACRPFGCGLDSRCPFRVTLPPAGTPHEDPDGRYAELVRYNAQCQRAVTKQAGKPKKTGKTKDVTRQKESLT